MDVFGCRVSSYYLIASVRPGNEVEMRDAEREGGQPAACFQKPPFSEEA